MICDVCEKTRENKPSSYFLKPLRIWDNNVCIPTSVETSNPHLLISISLESAARLPFHIKSPNTVAKFSSSKSLQLSINFYSKYIKDMFLMILRIDNCYCFPCISPFIIKNINTKKFTVSISACCFIFPGFFK